MEANIQVFSTEPNPYLKVYKERLGELALRGIVFKDPGNPELGFTRLKPIGQMSLTDGVPIITENVVEYDS
jgi:hypothetical protein